jgi:hypothetical protein
VMTAQKVYDCMESRMTPKKRRSEEKGLIYPKLRGLDIGSSTEKSGR